MSEGHKQTSTQAATAASEVLRDPDASAEDKKAAGSALSQKESKSKSGS